MNILEHINDADDNTSSFPVYHRLFCIYIWCANKDGAFNVYDKKEELLQQLHDHVCNVKLGSISTLQSHCET